MLNDSWVKSYPTVPTLKEITGEEVISYAAHCLCVASDMPADKRKTLPDAIIKAANDPEYVMTYTKMGDVMDIRTGEKLDKLLRQAEALALSVAYWKD